MIRNRLVVVVVRAGFGVLRTVPDELKIPIAAVPRVRAGVPLADLGRKVAVGPKYLGPEWRLLRIVYTSWIRPFHSHGLDSELMTSRKQSSSRGHAPGADVRCRKPHTLLRQTINCRGPNPRVGFRIGTDSPVRMVVGIDEQDVWPVCVGGASNSAQYQPTPQANHKAAISRHRHLPLKCELPVESPISNHS